MSVDQHPSTTNIHALYPPKYYSVDPKTGILGPKRTAEVTPVYNFEEEVCYYDSNQYTTGKPFFDSIWAKLLCGSVFLLSLAFLAACIVIPLYLIPVLTVTKIVWVPTEVPSATLMPANTTPSTSTTMTTTVTTTTAVTWYIPSNYGMQCADACISVTTVTPATLLASWQFENNLFDSTGNRHGFIANGTVYVPGYVNQGVFLNNSQYIASSGPFLNLTHRSFTVEAWIYLTALNVTFDTGIFAQCHNFTTRHCLHFVIRARKLYMGLLYDDAVGNTNVPLNNWTHIAFVYDMSTNSKLIYFNGLLDGFNVSAGPYLGSSGTLLIGFTNHSSTANPLTGFIDHLTVSNRAKTPCEIFNDATLVARFPFDNTVTDIGPNNLPSYSPVSLKSGLSYVAGRVNQSLLMSSNSAFFQACSFVALGQTNRSFTLALWINPSAPLGTILHLASDRSGSGNWCLPKLGFSSNGSIVAQSWNGVSVISVLGPQIPINNWTHIAQTWSSTNGLRLYVNGGLYGSSFMPTYTASNTPNMCILLGTSGFGTHCATSHVVMGPYAGAIDEFYVYNRELTLDEICHLVNP